MSQSRRFSFELILWLTGVILVFGLLVFLRLNFLDTNPGWYSDEGSDLDIARHLAQGQWQYFALGGTPLIAARVPLFHLLLGLGFQVWGYDIATARLVVALFSLATAGMLFIAVREMLGKWTALLTVLMFAILPNILLYSRIAFGYNVQAFFVVVCWYALWKFYVTRARAWLVLASLAVGAAYMTALTALPLIVCVSLVVLITKPRELTWAFLLMLAPGVVFIGLLDITAPTALFQDLALTFGRANDSMVTQLFNLTGNYVFWFDWTFWVALGSVGLFLLPVRSARWLALLLCFSILFSTMRAFPAAGDLNLHRYLGVVPFLALGSAQFLVSAASFLGALVRADLASWRMPRGLSWLENERWQKIFVYILFVVFLIAPLSWLAMWSVYLVAFPLSPRPTRLDSVMVTNPTDARQIVEWVNSRTADGDVVVASPTLAWLLDANATDFQQALAYEGIATDNYGKGLPRARFLYDVSFENAKFVITDRLWRGWAFERMPRLKDYSQLFDSWSHVKSQGEFDVYQNPAR